MNTKESIMSKTIDMSHFISNKFVQIVINILFGISVTALNLILIEQKFADNYVYILLPVCSFIIAEIMTIKFQFLKNTFKETKKSILIFSVICGIFETIYLYKNMEYEICKEQLGIARFIAIPAVIIFLYWFYHKFVYYFKKYIKSLDKFEKNYLIIMGTILIVSILIIYNLTRVFYSATIPGQEEKYRAVYQNEEIKDEAREKELVRFVYETSEYDIIYTSDTAPLINENVYTNIATDQNDFRQPLFGVFAIPFHILPKIIANIFYDIHNLYPILIAIIQGILVLITITLIARLIKLEKISKLLFLLTLTLTFPTLLFLLNIEQYIMAIFYLVLFIYMALNKLEDKDILYIMSTGSMLTSGIFFPLLGERKNLKQSIKNIFFTFLKCMAILIISARIILVFPKGMKQNLERMKQFSVSEYTITDKMNMYTNFIKNTAIFSKFETQGERKEAKLFIFSDGGILIEIDRPAITQMNTLKTSIIGVIMFVITILGFILNRKDTFSKIAFTWATFSILLLLIMGWGTSENGLILYTFYFSWAFISLIYKFFEKIFSKHRKIKNTIYIVLLIFMITVNLYGIYEIIQFGLNFYRC